MKSNVYFQAVKHPWVPNVILVVISLTVGFATFLLPETVDKPLPQTVEDVKLLYKSRAELGLGMSGRNIHGATDRIKDYQNGSEKNLSINLTSI